MGKKGRKNKKKQKKINKQLKRLSHILCTEKQTLTKGLSTEEIAECYRDQLPE